MSKPDTTATTDLILSGTIAKTPMSLRGTVEGGKFAGFTGRVVIARSLSSLLDDLGAGYGEAAQVLGQLLDGKVSDIKLESLAFGYRNITPKLAQVVVTMTVAGSSFRFVILKMIGVGGFIAGLDLQWDKALFKNNPLAGLTGEITIRDLAIYYASTAFRNVRYYPTEAFQDATVLTPNTAEISGRDFTAGLNWSAEILVDGVNLLDLLRTQESGSSRAPEAKANKGPAGGPAASLPKGSTFWIKTDKTIGPLSIQRVGLNYESPRVGVKLDAGLRLSCLTFSLEGLGLSYPLNKFTTDPKTIWENLRFHLDGAAVAFEQGPLTISGGLLLVKEHPLQLDGTLLIRTEVLTISALGSYADLDGTPSFFVFAALQKELGGPAFFFITGVAFGFGVNRALKLPAINEVQNFPLIRAATDADYLGKGLDLRAVSQSLGDYIYPSKGNFWVAAGIKFTSFSQIESFALLSVSFGTHFEIAMLGLSKIRVPSVPAGGQEVPAIVYAEMAIKVAFSPEIGLLSFEAMLTANSYVLRKDFKLRGGFAFYSWFAGEHEGDFVVSLGGYHPRFRPPAHYPKPDLVEFNCKTGDVTIQGFCYFALCPSAIMAGGGLSIVYESDGIKAWFIAYAHFLIQWKPLYYDIAIGITVGVALNLKIGIIRISLSVELGASVELHGPPLGGTARVSLYIITFTVSFGADKRLPPPLLWESSDTEKSFAKSFLPNPEVTRISIADGLLEEVRHGDEITRFVNPQKLVMHSRTVVPATAARFNSQEFARDSKDEKYKIPQPKVNGRGVELGVRSMGKSMLYSLVEVTLEPDGGSSEAAKKYLEQYIEVSLTTRSVPLALWGSGALDMLNPPQDQMIDDSLVGFQIKTKAGPRPWETPALDLKVLAYDRYPKDFARSTIQPRQALPAFGQKTISNTIEEEGVVARRTRILGMLAATGRRIMKPEAIDLSQLKESAQYIFQAMPAMARAGQYPPRGYLET
jgi:hypothetical protein